MIRLPILLIHGFNGSPANWTGPADRFPEYLASYGLDPELIRVFSYGYDVYKGKRTYDNLGDISRIAHRLDDRSGDDAINCSVDLLSEQSQSRGASPKVTIIAHSSGGLVARYYLTRQAEDEFGTKYRGNVGRVIFLGTPHRGVDVENLLDPLPTNIVAYRLMIQFHYLFPRGYTEQSDSLRHQFNRIGSLTRQAFLGDGKDGEGETPAFRQMHPNSHFLNEINRPGAMPTDVHYDNIVGDVRAVVKIDAFGRTLIHSERSFGDFLVTTASAGSIPNARSRCFPVVSEYSLNADIGRRTSNLIEMDHIGSHQVPIHRHLRSIPASRQKILEILGVQQLGRQRADCRKLRDAA